MQQAGNMIDLKDQFALAAMAALLQRSSNSAPHYVDVANAAWQCAEFMMSERQKRIDLAALNEKRNNSDMQTLKLSTRLHYALLSEDLYSIADICCNTEKEILKIPNIGLTQLAHLKIALAAVGESLAVPSEK
jgi:DNA-directed RNA polymerase alpha subunit